MLHILTVIQLLDILLALCGFLSDTLSCVLFWVWIGLLMVVVVARRRIRKVFGI